MILSATGPSEDKAALLISALPPFAMARDLVPSTCRVLPLSVPEVVVQSVLPDPTDSNPRIRVCAEVRASEASPTDSTVDLWSLHAARATATETPNSQSRRAQDPCRPFAAAIA